VLAATNLGELYLRRELAAEALEWLEEALRRAGELGTDHPVATTQVPLAEAFVQLGRHVEAWEAATLALENGAAPELRSRAHRARAAALAATGGRARAEQELVEAATARSDCPGRNVRRTKTAPT